MTSCRFFDAGYCKYGVRCRNYHFSGPPRVRKAVKPRPISPVWQEVRKWSVLSEQDNLSTKFRFMVPSPTTKDWSVWDNSDSEGEYDPGQSKLMRLESATLSILKCPRCSSHILSGEGFDVIICDTCDNPIQNSKFSFDPEKILEIAEENLIEVESPQESSLSKTSDDSNLSEKDDNIGKDLINNEDNIATDSVDLNQNNLATVSVDSNQNNHANQKNRKKKKNKHKKKGQKSSPVQSTNNNEPQPNDLSSPTNTEQKNIVANNPNDINVFVKMSIASSCPHTSSRTGTKGWKRKNNKRKLLSSSVTPFNSTDTLQRVIPFSIPLLLVFIWAVFM